ncbi:hypothetical protein [Francisella tularensis]|uniref:hypothetical protein n=1 Tax=Francisella tularensis TaxID=263 RepID=UPI001C0EDED6|nr:hypothetical protein [Francisella tularensis]MBK2110033.1 hypothetical protein [Francisella tularensis subsp. novicida FSC595]
MAWFLSLLLTIFILIHVNYVPINNNTIYIESTLNKYSAHMYLPLSILFILSISFTGWARRLAIVVFVIISGLFILMILKSGNRAAVIPIVILIIIYFFEKNGKLNFFKMLIYFLLIFLSLYILVFIGLFRSNPNIDLLSIDTSNLIFKKLFILETAQAAFYSTVTSIQVSQIMSFSFWDFIKGIFVGGSSISYITNSIIPNIGGSVFPIYFVFYFKWFGAVFSGLSLVFVINYLSRSNQSSITKYILLMVLINVFDWYLYSPFVLIRGCIISGFIVIWFIIIFLKVRITK